MADETLKTGLDKTNNGAYVQKYLDFAGLSHFYEKIHAQWLSELEAGDNAVTEANCG